MGFMLDIVAWLWRADIANKSLEGDVALNALIFLVK